MIAGRLPLVLVAAYAWYLWSLTGSWTSWYQAQADGWSRGFTWPWVSLRQTLEATVPGAYPDHPEWAWVFRAELVSMAVGLLVMLFATLAGVALTNAFPDSRFIETIEHSLIIFGWVALWRPIEILLYDRWPLIRARKLFQQVSERGKAVTTRLDAAELFAWGEEIEGWGDGPEHARNPLLTYEAFDSFAW